MIYSLVFQARFQKKLRKLDPQVARRILLELSELQEHGDPTFRCKPLQGPLKGLWRFRAGDYRVILDIRKSELTIIALDTDHRSRVYDD